MLATLIPTTFHSSDGPSVGITKVDLTNVVGRIAAAAVDGGRYAHLLSVRGRAGRPV